MDMKNLYSEVAAVCARHGGRTCIYQYSESGRETVSFRKLFDEIVVFQNFLLGQGLDPGARIAILSENRYEWLVAYLAIVSSGFTAVPLDPKLTSTEWVEFLNHSESKFLFASASLLESSPGLSLKAPGLICAVAWGPPELSTSWIYSYADVVREELERGGPFKTALPEPVEPASLVYTSGTSGRPKGVMLSHAGLLNNAQEISLGAGVPGEILATILPLHHLFGFSVACAALLKAVGLVFYDEINPTVVLRSFAELRPHMLIGVPLFFERLSVKIRERVKSEIPARLAEWIERMEAEPCAESAEYRRWFKKLLFGKVHRQFGGRLQFAACGGAPLEARAEAFFNLLGIPLYQGYGLTETSAVCAVNRPGQHRVGSVGKAIPGAQIEVRNVGEDGIGEVWMRGPGRLIGYFDDESATEEVLDKEGWFYTGDLGRLDEEGYLFITGRKKDLIVGANGEKVFPDEVEAHFQGVAGIQELSVFGIPRGPGMKGELVHLRLVPDMSRFPKKTAEQAFQALKRALDERAETLPDFKRPKSVDYSTKPLPRTTTLKVRRFALRQEWIDRLHRESLVARVGGHVKVAKGSTVADFVLDSLRRLLPQIGEIGMRSSLALDLGIDSLTALEFWNLLEEELGLSIPKEEAFGWREVGDVVAYLEARLPGGRIPLKSARRLNSAENSVS